MENTNIAYNAYEAKRRARVPSWVWFWVHKAIFLAMTIMVFLGLPDDDRYSDSWVYEDYSVSYDRLTDAQKHLSRQVVLGAVQMMALVMMCVVTYLRIRAYKKENPDIDLINDLKKKGEKGTLLRFIRRIADFLLDLVMVVMAVKSLNAVNYAFLSEDIAHCSLFSKTAQLRAFKSDVKKHDIVTESFEVSDISVEMTDRLDYKLSEVSPYVWAIWFPGDADIIIWWDWDGALYSMNGPVFVDLKDEKTENIQFFRLKCGDEKSFPVSWDDNYSINDILSHCDDKNVHFEISYYKNSRVLESVKAVNEDTEGELFISNGAVKERGEF